MAESFRQLQYAFAAHLRHPEKHPAPAGIEDRRLEIYRGLFFNNAKSLLAGTFPVLSDLLGEERWAELIRDYYDRHVAHTPLFLEVPQELLAYLESEFDPELMSNPADWPPFMHELAHYEWVELALTIDQQEIDDEKFNPDGNMLDGIPVISPVAWPLAYGFPVHRIGPDFQPDAPGEQPTFLVVYRRHNDEVGFTEINAVTARLLELIQTNTGSSGRDLLLQIAQELKHPDPDVVVRGGEDIFSNLQQQDILLGTRN